MLTQEGDDLNSPNSAREIEFTVTKPMHKEIQDTDGLTDEFSWTFKKEIITILHRHLQKIKGEEIVPHSF